MKRWKRMIAKVRSLLRNDRVEQDHAREVASHLTLLEMSFYYAARLPMKLD